MERMLNLFKTASAIVGFSARHVTPLRYFSLFENTTNRGRLLAPTILMTNQSCGFKVKGRVRRRCKSCYFVVRDERLYVICPEHPRHKQMAMKPKPLTTYILTHATQSKIRPW